MSVSARSDRLGDPRSRDKVMAMYPILWNFLVQPYDRVFHNVVKFVPNHGTNVTCAYHFSP